MKRIACFLSILAAACSSSSESAPVAAPSGDAVPAEGAEQRAPAPIDFPTLAVHRSDTAVAPPRDHHSTAIVETASGVWLYVIGGTNAWDVIHNDVQRARISETGEVGAFESAGTLPEPRAGHCMVKKADRIYLFGGVVGSARNGPSTSSVILTLDAEGKVSATAKGPDLPLAVMHVGCEMVGDYVYALGGRGSNSKSTKLSARTKINGDGSASPFEEMRPLIPDRSHHAVFARNKTIYVVGGLTGDPIANPTNRKDVVMADVQDDGTLSEWYDAGRLPSGLSVSSAQLYEDAVYVFGGLEDSGFTSKIRRATFNADATLTDFETLKSELPDARGHVHQTPMWKSFIFSVGGKNDGGESLGTIDVGRFDK